MDRTTKIGQAKSHLATCMERDDFPWHNCACNCDDVTELLAEVERLRAALTQIENWAGKAYSNLGEAELVRMYIEQACEKGLGPISQT